jgi:hypothetical protein
VVDENGLTHVVEGVFDRGWLTDQTVYNLTIGDLHTFVVGADGTDIVVHNTSACPIGGGRSGRSRRYLELASDDKLPRHMRGWMKNQLRQGRRKLPPGYQLAHYRTHEAARGCSYLCSHLNLTELHRLQHRYDRNGRALRWMRRIVR